MKIPSITRQNYTLNNQQKSSKTKNQYDKTRFLPVFKAINPADLKKLPLEKKLSHLFSNAEFNDLIVVAKNLQEVKTGLKNIIGSFSSILKRLVFVQHGGLSVPLAFNINRAFDRIMCVNIGEKPILVASSDDTDQLNPADSIAINDGDVIINNKVNIPVETVATYSGHIDSIEDFAILSDVKSFATKVFDYSEVQEEKIALANKEILKNISDIKDVSQKEVKSKVGITFNDVGGLDNVITKLKKGILYPIEYPYAYQDRKSLNRGFILYGPPGTGKTLLAQALANEVNASYVKLNGLEMESKWVGESEENWRTLFNTAKENQPAIIFIDEFDAVARNRGGQDVHGDKVVNQMLTLMSDIEKENQQVFVIAATNKLESVDSAVVRSGRFGEHIEVPAPDRTGLDKIFEVHARGKNIDSEFNKNELLDKCADKKMTGADIAYLLNKAHEVSWERCGIYEKMENHTLTKEDIVKTSIIEEDFNNAYDEMIKSRTKQTRNPIGYKR